MHRYVSVAVLLVTLSCNAPNTAAGGEEDRRDSGTDQVEDVGDTATDVLDDGTPSADDTGGDSTRPAAPDVESDDGSMPTPTELPRAYMANDRYSRLVFEVDRVTGRDPRPEAVDHLLTSVREVVDKPDGVELVLDGSIPSVGADYVWTFDELDELARAEFDLDVTDDTIKIGVLYVDGRYEGDDGDRRVLGIAWSNRFIVMFADNVDSACSVPLVDVCGPAEASVLLHEAGHVLGLVDNGAPMVVDHRDPDHGHHDIDRDCVMYWTYTGSDVVDVVVSRIGGPDPALGLGDNCKDDLRALQ